MDNRAGLVADSGLPAGGCPQGLDNDLRPLPTFPQSLLLFIHGEWEEEEKRRQCAERTDARQ
jgi:hypothetical protein